MTRTMVSTFANILEKARQSWQLGDSGQSHDRDTYRHVQWYSFREQTPTRGRAVSFLQIFHVFHPLRLLQVGDTRFTSCCWLPFALCSNINKSITQCVHGNMTQGLGASIVVTTTSNQLEYVILQQRATFRFLILDIVISFDFRTANLTFCAWGGDGV